MAARPFEWRWTGLVEAHNVALRQWQSASLYKAKRNKLQNAM
jgi:hypothetical protein